MEGTLQQQSIEVEDALVVQELFYQNEWTDGLPVVPPTKDKIETMLETVPMDPQTIIGTIPERGSVFTLEVAAINAVMAGCLPEYFPVVEPHYQPSAIRLLVCMDPLQVHMDLRS